MNSDEDHRQRAGLPGHVHQQGRLIRVYVALALIGILDMLALDAIAELLEDAVRDATDDLMDRIVEMLAASGRPIRPPEGA